MMCHLNIRSLDFVMPHFLSLGRWGWVFGWLVGWLVGDTTDHIHPPPRKNVVVFLEGGKNGTSEMKKK